MTDRFLRTIEDFREEEEARLEREMDPDMALASDFVIGALPEEQARQVRERIVKDPAFRDLVEPLLLLEQHGPRHQPMPREKLERHWLELRGRIGLPELPGARGESGLDAFRKTIALEKRRTRRRLLVGFAATLALFATWPAILFIGRIQNDFNRTDWGRTEIVAMPDGSRAVLSMGTRLFRPSGAPPRTWVLFGEASFEVVPSTTPFVVETESAVITVTGTRFTVHAYRREPTILTVTEGSVRVQPIGADDKPFGLQLDVGAGQKARVVRGFPAEIVP